MLFQHTLKLILSKRKKQTRRLIKLDEIAIRGRNNRIEAVVVNGRDKWRVGKTYAVQPSRGKGQVARIRLVAINSERLSRISTEDAHAEGFANRQEFFSKWCEIHGDDSLNSRVWILKFEVESISINILDSALKSQQESEHSREVVHAH